MRKNYLKPETESYCLKVEGPLLDSTTVRASTRDPQEGGDPTGQSNPSTPSPFPSNAKSSIWNDEESVEGEELLW